MNPQRMETSLIVFIALNCAQLVLIVAAVIWKTPANASIFDVVSKILVGIEEVEGVTPIMPPNVTTLP